jgi:hypothetical protein
MSKPMMIARFSLNSNNTHYQVWDEKEPVELGIVGSELAIASGGFVNNSGELDESGRYFVLFGVCEVAAKLFDVAPEEFIETVFSAETQKEFGVIDLTIERRGE